MTTAPTTVTATAPTESPTLWAALIKRITLATIAVAVLLGAALAATGTAQAVTTNCSDGRCVIYLNKAETRQLAEGKAPKLPPGLPWQITVSYTALTKGHQLIARQYANRGWCSAFLLSPRPWDNQGYTGYKC